MRRFSNLIAAATFTVASTASAQDSSSPRWNGTYIGAHAGKSWGEFSDIADLTTHNTRELGVYAGYNWQVGQLVFGIEGEAGALKGGGQSLTNFFRISRNLETTTPDLGSLRTRLGFVMDRALFFVAGGVSFSRARLELRDEGTTRTIITPPGRPGRIRFVDVPFSSTKTLDDSIGGYVIGGGVDYKFSPSISGRLEGMQYGFKNVWSEGNSYQTTTVRAGLAYHFN
jgi:opacity protein-like surface antigen